METLRTDRLGLLLDQLDRAREFAQAQLEGLASPASLPSGTPLGPRRADPAPGRGLDARAFGPGEWALDNDWPIPT